ncbi:MAG: glycoside hydrolase family 36 protein [Acidimicrobiales bacterium]
MTAAFDSPVLRVVPVDGPPSEAALAGAATHPLGPVEVTVDVDARGWRWSIANRGDHPVALRSVEVSWDLGVAGSDLTMFRNGYQSWSPAGPVRPGVDVDPSAAAGAPTLMRGMHHADAAVVTSGALRSEMVTVIDRGDAAADDVLLVGFVSGRTHDGTVWVRLDERRHLQVTAQAFLGGATLPAGHERDLHSVELVGGRRSDVDALLGAWATRVGEVGGARVSAPFQVGWCSWYHYFHDISEDALRHNLALAGQWPFEVFQLDDGYQSDIGDWLTTNERFPSSLDTLAADIAAAGVTPGVWLAPFLAGPASRVVDEHPDWIARHTSGRPLVGMVNDGWGGPVLTLDTTRADVLDHIESTARALVEAGFPYLKLDFTYAPSLDGRFSDPTRTPAERVRAGMEAVRRGAGEETFLLGCGLPLGVGVGVVDGMRIGADVAPWWEVQPDQFDPPGYSEVEPATLNAYVNTRARAFMHRRLWLNDPDCVMLRTTETRLTPDQVRTWAMAVGDSGGMVLVSDDLALLDADARALLDEVVARGRAADAEATVVAGREHRTL